MNFMMQSTETNQVIITGKVVDECQLSHELYGEKFYEFKLEVPRLSESADILPVTISERLVTEGLLVNGNFVSVEGQFRSYNNRKDNGNKLKLVIFARDVKEIKEEDIKNPNYVLLDGFLCKEPIYRTTPLGREICDIILAVNRAYHKSDYIPIITWGRNARFSQKLNVGDNVKVWGRIQSRDYEKKLDNGEVIRRTAYEVSVSKMEISSTNNRKDEE
jgi:single-stranded DNA-binding protein